MATFRVGVGSFNIKDGAVGFGTDTDGLGNLRVEGTTKVIGSKVSGASTLTRYSGFAADNINQLENITLTSEVGTIGDIVVGVGTSVIISSASTVTVGTVESVSIGTHFSPPVGGTEDRGEDFVEGMMRFNTDLNTMEFYNGNEWRQFTYISDIKSSPSSRGRAIFAAGNNNDTPDGTSSIEFVNISSQGNGISFGDLTRSAFQVGGSGSDTRGVFGGGDPGPSSVDVIDYITIASSGDAIDFGNLSAAGRCSAGASSQTRALFLGVNATNVIDFIEIQTLGNAVDFGDVANGQSGSKGYAASSPTRYIYYSGLTIGNSNIQFGTIASKGNTATFGETNGQFRRKNCASNSIRAIFAGGYHNPDGGTTLKHDNIDFITIASEGNAVDFGNLSVARSRIDMTGNQRTCLMAGGQPGSAAISLIESVNYSSNGTVQFFGDLATKRNQGSATSDSHGGLGGY